MEQKLIPSQTHLFMTVRGGKVKNGPTTYLPHVANDNFKPPTGATSRCSHPGSFSDQLVQNNKQQNAQAWLHTDLCHIGCDTNQCDAKQLPGSQLVQSQGHGCPSRRP